MEEKHILLHVHIPRTGGVTLNSVLERSFRHGFVNLYQGVRTFNASEIAALAVIFHKAQCITSHHIMGPIPQPDIGNTRYLPICFVRHPVKRCISEYMFKKNNAMRGISKKKFKYNSYVDYFHRFNERSSENSNEQFQRNNNIQSHYIFRNGKLDDVVGKGIDSFFFIGSTDRFDQSIVLLNLKLRRLGLKLDLRFIPRNASPQKIGDENAAELILENQDLILSHSQLDLALYNAINEKLDTQISLEGDSFVHELDKFRRTQNKAAILMPVSRFLWRASRYQTRLFERIAGV